MDSYEIVKEANNFTCDAGLFSEYQPNITFITSDSSEEKRLEEVISEHAKDIILYQFDDEGEFSTIDYQGLSELRIKGHNKLFIGILDLLTEKKIGDINITIVYGYFGHDLTFELDISNAKTTYLWSSETDTISADGVTATFCGEKVPDESLEWSLDELNKKIKYKEVAIYNVVCKYYVEVRVTGSGGTDITEQMCFIGSYKVTGKPLSVIQLAGNTVYYDTFYDDDSKAWTRPAKGRYQLVYDNDAVVYYDVNDEEHVNYYLDRDCTKEAEGVVLKHEENEYIYTKLETFDLNNNVVKSFRKIKYLETVPETVEATGEFVLTNKPLSQKDKIKISVTFNSGTHIDDLPYAVTDGWRFETPDTRYMDTTKPLRIIINKFGHENEPIEIKPTFKNPTSKTQGVVIYGKKLSTALVNGSTIDLTDTYLRTEYDDSDYYEDLGYFETSDGSGHYSVFCTALGDSFRYDGSQSIAIDTDDNLSKTLSISFSGRDSFKNNVIQSIDVNVYEITEILAVSCISPKTKYTIGDSFLDENDDTKAKIWYKDKNGAEKTMTIKLNSHLDYLSIYPAKGTVFSYSGKQTVRVQSIFDSTKYFTYDITVSSNVRYSSETKTLNFRFVKLKGDITYKTENGEIELKAGTYVKVLQDDVTAEADPNCWTLKNGLSTSYDSLVGIKIYGYLENVGDKDHNGVLVDFNDYVPPIDGVSNATIKFPCYDKDASSFVDGCTFGVRFGHNNSLNRLFISGNPDKPNYDIHSVEPNLTNEDEASSVLQGDFSYFPDEAMCKYGESENSIVGYDVVSDTKLLVLKNRSAREKTIYFRVPTMVTMLDSSGSAMTDLSGGTLYQEEYSVYMSNSSVAGISPDSIANFNGDTVFVDDECEVAGLDIEGIIGDSQRQANSRSKYIDGKLREYDLSKATLTVYQRYLILDIPGVASFVTDRSSISGSQYEWWKCDPLNAVCFMEMDGELYYATTDGAICRLSDSSYSDKDRYFIDVALSGDTFKNDVLMSKEYTDIMKDGAEYTWMSKPFKNDYEGYLYARIMDVREGDEAEVDLTDNTIKISSDHMSLKDYLGSANIFYINSYYGNAYSAEYGKPYRLMNVKTEDGLDVLGTFKLLDEDFNEVDLTKFKDGFEIVKRLQGEVDARSNGDGSIKLYDHMGKPYDLVRYAGQDPSVSISGVLTRVRPIKSRLVSSPLLIETANWFKHVIKLDISQGTNDKSDLMVAYCNNKMPYIVEDEIKDRGQTIDLGSFSFSNVDFSSNFYTRTYTIGKELKCIKYICVAFASDRDMNSVVPSISMTYTVSTLSKGIAD